MSSLIHQLKASRQKCGMKQAVLGAKLGLPQSHISTIERGHTDPRLSTIQDMAQLLDHELMLIPRPLIPHIQALLRGEQGLKPRWSLDQEDDI